MRRALLVALACWAAAAFAQSPESQRAINRALIERDQQSAEFAAGLHGRQAVRDLEALHQRQLQQAGVPTNADPDLATRDLPSQRQRMAEEHVLRLPPPIVRVAPPEPPLPLPGGPRPGVEPVAPERRGG